jgi:hypothetical protein
MNTDRRWLLLCIFGVVVFLLSSTGGIVVGPVSAPPYKSDQPTFMVTISDTPQARVDLAKTHPGVLDAIDDWATERKVEYRLDNAGDPAAPVFAMAWVQEAWKVADRAHPPSIVGASPKVGIKPQPLPATPEKALELLKPLAP